MADSPHRTDTYPPEQQNPRFEPGARPPDQPEGEQRVPDPNNPNPPPTAPPNSRDRNDDKRPGQPG